MKYTINIILMVLIITSCSKKPSARGSFKLVLGKIVTNLDGGAYVNATSVASPLNIIKLDTDNSALIPKEAKDLILVAFTGPLKNSGPYFCGSVLNVNITKAEEDYAVNLSQTNCDLPLYEKTILELKKGIVSKWDNDRFNLSYWAN